MVSRVGRLEICPFVVRFVVQKAWLIDSPSTANFLLMAGWVLTVGNQESLLRSNIVIELQDALPMKLLCDTRWENAGQGPDADTAHQKPSGLCSDRIVSQCKAVTNWPKRKKLSAGRRLHAFYTMLMTAMVSFAAHGLPGAGSLARYAPFGVGIRHSRRDYTHSFSDVR